MAERSTKQKKDKKYTTTTSSSSSATAGHGIVMEIVVLPVSEKPSLQQNHAGRDCTIKDVDRTETFVQNNDRVILLHQNKFHRRES
jgi:hypothetical protein